MLGSGAGIQAFAKEFPLGFVLIARAASSTKGASAMEPLKVGICYAGLFLAGLMPAVAGERIILQTAPMERGSAFYCRIPVTVRYEGTRPLQSLRVLAAALDEGERLSSTGIASRRPIIARPLPNGTIRYTTVPMQFDLTYDTCLRADALVIEFAACKFGERPYENCLNNIRFATTSDLPRHQSENLITCESCAID